MSPIVAEPRTIIALASGQGRAGVAVVRVSGPQALGICAALTVGRPPLPYRVSVRDLVDPRQSDFIDRAMVLVMPAPRSFTGEDVVEFHVHGGKIVVETVLEAALATGMCRPSGPGEFTRRAFENGKLDLAQAEAVADLIDAETEKQRQLAGRVYRGESSQVFDLWRETLVSAMSSLEASIDFPDEADVPASVMSDALSRVEDLSRQLRQALDAADKARAVREGVRVAILGAPNAGKSTLLNRLAGRDAAIVSPVPGTTRDVIEISLLIEGFVVFLSDTAGIRTTVDPVEREGVKRALGTAGDADIRLWVEDSSLPATDGLEVVERDMVEDGDVFVLNKIDRLSDHDLQRVSPSSPHWSPTRNPVVHVSAERGDGVDQLTAILAAFVRDHFSSDEPLLLTRTRHCALIESAHSSVQRALSGLKSGVGPELVFEDLRLASRRIGEITGAVDVDDLLDKIFADFCIGK